MNFGKYLSNIFVATLFDNHKFYDPPPGDEILMVHITPYKRNEKKKMFF